ncbi:MAG TPA: hypothetical protein VGC57_07260 [Cellulomonas sp.]
MSAPQAAQIYRALRGVDASRRASRRAARHLLARPEGRHRSAHEDDLLRSARDLDRETGLQTTILLLEPYVGAGGSMSAELAARVVDLLAEADVRADAQPSDDTTDPTVAMAEAVDRVLLRAHLLAEVEAATGRSLGGEVPQQRGPLDV